MANYPLYFSGGIGYKKKVPSAWIDQVDVYMTKVPNWMDGSDHTTSGPVILRGGELYAVDAFRADSARITITTGKSLTADAGSTVALKGTVKLYSPTEIEFDAARSYTAGVKGVLGFDAAEWRAGLGYMDQTNLPGGSNTAVPWILDVPPGATITAIRARVDPVGGHGALPAPLPELIVQEHDPATGTSTTIANIVDGSASVGAYEPAHDIVATGLSYVAIANRNIFAFAYGEGATDGVAGLRFYPPRVEFTMTKMRHP